jgi:hypothetical protein
MFWFLSTIIILYLYLLLVQIANRQKPINQPLPLNDLLYKSPKVYQLLKIYTRQCIRWSYASTQDKNPVIALLHADYGNAYLMVIKDYVQYFEISFETFEKVTELKLKELEIYILKNQDIALKKLVATKEISIDSKDALIFSKL